MSGGLRQEHVAAAPLHILPLPPFIFHELTESSYFIPFLAGDLFYSAVLQSHGTPRKRRQKLQKNGGFQRKNS